eukprot:gene6980-4944_t
MLRLLRTPLGLSAAAAVRFTSTSLSTPTTTAAPAEAKPKPAVVVPAYKTSHKTSSATAAGIGSKKTVADLAAGLRRSSCGEESGPLPPRDLTPLQKRQLLMKNKSTFILTPQAIRRVRYLMERYQAAHGGAHDESTTTAAHDAGSSSTAAGGGDATNAGGPQPDGIRIGVRRRGCSGYSYTVNYHFPSPKSSNTGGSAPEASKKQVWNFMEEDTVVEQEGLKVVVASDALFYVIGTVMDYVVLNVEEKFVFRNPNKKYSCGCEESFMPFDSEDMGDG